MLDQETLDALWDFGAPAESELRFRTAAESSADRDELMTQAARALGLQDRFDEGHALLEAIDSDTPVVRARVALERGRLHRSAGDTEASVPYFELAATTAGEVGLTFLQVDAWHMLAMADPSNADAHTAAAIGIADSATDDRTRRWGIALHNNLGWHLHDSGELESALAEFELALGASRAYGSADQIHIARWSVARCLRSLGRLDEACVIQQELDDSDPPDEYVEEELEALKPPPHPRRDN
jgi:tetratricopeptide (TPR) repeat protein